MKKFKLSVLMLAVSSVVLTNAYAADLTPVKADAMSAKDTAPSKVEAASHAQVESLPSAKPTPLSDSATKNLEEISRLNMEVMVLDAQLKKYDSESKIATKRAEISKLNVVKASDSDFSSSVYGTPTYKSIEGVGNVLYATINFPSGNEVDAKQGDILPNGMQVSFITKGRVEVSNGKRKISLMKTSTTPTTNQAPSQNNGIGSVGAFIPPMN